MTQTYNVIELNVDGFYSKRPRERIFTYSRRPGDKLPSSEWQIAHWDEFTEILAEQQHYGLSLSQATRFYFHYHTKHLADLVRSLELSLPELSLVIKEHPTKGKIFIPNISIKRATTGQYHQHRSIEDFLSSTSCSLVCNIAQNIAANPDLELDNEMKNKRFKEWINQHGSAARKLLKGSLHLDPSEKFVEGDSPDTILASLNHPLYEEVATLIHLEKKLDQTLEENGQ